MQFYLSRICPYDDCGTQRGAERLKGSFSVGLPWVRTQKELGWDWGDRAALGSSPWWYLGDTWKEMIRGLEGGLWLSVHKQSDKMHAPNRPRLKAEN